MLWGINEMSKALIAMNEQLQESIRLLEEQDRIIDGIIRKGNTMTNSDTLEYKRY